VISRLRVLAVLWGGFSGFVDLIGARGPREPDVAVLGGDLGGYAVWLRVLRAVGGVAGGGVWGTVALRPGLAAGMSEAEGETDVRRT
jgi:hypothetical protein